MNIETSLFLFLCYLVFGILFPVLCFLLFVCMFVWIYPTLQTRHTFYREVSFVYKLETVNTDLPILIQFMLEVILGTHGETEVAGKVLGHLEDSVPPVIGSFHVLDVVHIVVGHNVWRFEVIGVVPLSVPHQAMAAPQSYSNSSDCITRV